MARLKKKLKNSLLIEFIMKEPDDELPEVCDLTSNPIFTIIQGELYRGHYHANGWFYGSISGMRYGETIMAVCRKKNYTKLNSGVFSRPLSQEELASNEKTEQTFVDSWCYGSEILIH